MHELIPRHIVILPRRLSLEELQDRVAAHARLLVSPRALDASFVRRMHGRVGYVCVGYASLAEPEQRSALNRCTCQKLASRVGSAPVARRGAPAAAAPSACSASNVHNSPTQSTPGLRAQFLKTRHRRFCLPRHAEFCRRGWRPRGPLGDQVRVARERRYACLRPTAASSATTARDAAATAG